jgi:deazaflavin-dependent oxidoreductase (nitroreductase family)
MAIAHKYIHPGFFMTHVVNPFIKFTGAMPTLTVRGRRSGRPITTPLIPFDYEGARYLVAGGGETQWVRNLRAAGQGHLKIRGRDEDFRAVELQGAERDRIVAAFREHMGSWAKNDFQALPNFEEHPAFRVEPK